MTPGITDEPARGAQEVLIPRIHEWRMLLRSPGALEDLLTLLVRRIGAHKAAGVWSYAAAFMNGGDGLESGASQPHSHGQLWLLPSVPELAARELELAARHWQATRSCLFCEALAHQDLEVLVHQDCIALAREVARFPYEMLLLPREHRSHLEELPEREVGALAEALRRALCVLWEALDAPPFNVILHTAPLHEARPEFHLHFEIIPRLTRPGGWEVGFNVTNYSINPTPAAEAAARLRGFAAP